MKSHTQCRLLCLFLIIFVTVPLIGCRHDQSEVEPVREALTYGGYQIPENWFEYWMSTYKRNVLSSLEGASDSTEFWQSPYHEDQSIGEYCESVIQNRICDYLIALALFDQMQLALDESVIADINSDIAEKCEYYGGKDELNRKLKSLNISVDDLRDIYETEEKHKAVYRALYGENGTKTVTDAEIISYYESNYSRIRYIVFYQSDFVYDADGNLCYDDDGNAVTKPLIGDALTAKQKTIQECEAALSAGGDFIDLTKKYSENDHTETYPDGFFVSSNESSIWGNLIVNEIESHKAGEWFRVENGEAIYIILKCELTPFAELTDQHLSQLTKLFTYATNQKYEEQFSEYRKSVQQNDTVIADFRFETIKPNSFYSI